MPKPSAGLRESGPNVRFLQQQLRALHYAVQVTGRMDAQTDRAVIAYRKVNGFQRVTNATRTIFFALAQGRGAYRVRYPGDGRHVEADLTHQVLALVNPGGKVFRVYHTSSGRPSLKTPAGRFRVFSQKWGWHAGSFDGSYFVKSQGYTCGVHGYPYLPHAPGQPLLPAHFDGRRALRAPVDPHADARGHLLPPHCGGQLGARRGELRAQEAVPRAVGHQPAQHDAHAC